MSWSAFSLSTRKTGSGILSFSIDPFGSVAVSAACVHTSEVSQVCRKGVHPVRGTVGAQGRRRDPGSVRKCDSTKRLIADPESRHTVSGQKHVPNPLTYAPPVHLPSHLLDDGPFRSLCLYPYMKHLTPSTVVTPLPDKPFARHDS